MHWIKKERARELLSWLPFLAALAFALGSFLLLGEHNIDADSASEMVLAALLNREKAFLSRNWFYSTELRVVSPVPVYSFFLMFVRDWHLARFWSNAVLLTGMGLLLAAVGKAAGMGRRARIYAAVLLLPVSWAQRFLVSWYGFYTVYVMDACLILLLVMKSRGRLRLPLLLLVGVISGLSGVRMLMLVALPLTLSVLVCLLYPDRDREDVKRCVSVLINAAGMAAGYLINSRVLSHIYAFQQYDAQRMEAFSLENFLTWAQAFLKFAGYRAGVTLMSSDGLVDAALVVLLLASPVFLLYMLAGTQEMEKKRRMLFLYAFFGCLSVMVMVAACEWIGIKETSVGYFLPGFYFAFMFVLEETGQYFAGRKWVPGIAVFVLLAMGAGGSIRGEAISSRTSREKAAAWLQEQGYTDGYATYWNGNILTYFTDGALDVTTFGSWATPEPQHWLQERSHVMVQPEGPVFVCTDDVELGSFELMPFALEEHKVYEEDGICIYRYESGDEVIEALIRGC